MENYYQYFKEKGNHPQKDDILSLEKTFNFSSFKRRDALELVYVIVEHAKKLNSHIGIRIVLENEIVIEYYDDHLDIKNAKSWIERKEKVTMNSTHSSYYCFLDSFDKTQYDEMILDESYALCGGSFPIRINGEYVGSITVTGRRPHEDHQIIIDGMRIYKER